MTEMQDQSSTTLRPALNRGRQGTASVGVLTVIKEEFEEVSALFGNNLNLPNTSYYVRNLNTSRCYDVVLKKLAGRGNIVSAMGAREFLEDFRPNYLLLVGIAGGIKGTDLPQLARMRHRFPNSRRVSCE